MTSFVTRVCPNCDRAFATETVGSVACPTCGHLVADPRAHEAAETRACPMCAASVPKTARKCRHCGEYFDASGAPLGPPALVPAPPRKDEGTAAVLSFFVPGLGHLYAGRIRHGLYIVFAYGLVILLARAYLLVPFLLGQAEMTWGVKAMYLVTLGAVGLLLVAGWIAAMATAARAAREWSPPVERPRPAAAPPSPGANRETHRPVSRPAVHAAAGSPADRERQDLLATARQHIAGKHWTLAAELAREFSWRYIGHPDTTQLMSDLQRALSAEIRRDVRTHDWARAVTVAESVIRLFPDSRDAQDLAARLAILKLRARVCPGCGRHFKEGAEKCVNCGALLTRPAELLDEDAADPPPPAAPDEPLDDEPATPERPAE